MSSANPSNNHAKVYIWETKVGNEDGEGTTVGHASVELQGTGNGRYFSFRPRNSFFVNPLLFWLPTTGKSLGSVQEDIHYEGKAPDRTFQVELSTEQMQSASKKVDQLREEAQQGTLLYHLFPRLSILTPLQKLATKTAQEELTKCPFTEQKMGDNRHEEFEDFLTVRSGHCSSTVHEVLNEAEIDLPPVSLAPWLVTPSALGDQVSRFSTPDQ